MSLNKHGLDIEFVELAGYWPDRKRLESNIMKAMKLALYQLGLETGRESSVSLAFSDDAEVAKLNAEFRGRDDPTNVLSFPSGLEIDPGAKQIPDGLLGDIILASDTITREAERDDKSFDDHALHLALHGFLHLLGYSHESDSDADIMESLEIRILREMKIPNPYEAAKANTSS